MDSLIDKKCKPCEGKVSSYSKDQAKQFLAQVPGWDLNNEATMISCVWVTRNFKEALNFIGLVGQVAEGEDHHPDIHLTNYRKVTIELTTHAIKGLSENDFIVAAKINQLPVELKT